MKKQNKPDIDALIKAWGNMDFTRAKHIIKDMYKQGFEDGAKDMHNKILKMFEECNKGCYEKTK